MTWKIEKVVTGKSTAFRLSGRIHAAHLKELKAVLGDGAPAMALDIEEVTIVDVDVVRYLGQLERKGVRLLNCSPYIREWISQEYDSGRKNC
jgi:anti-anti-sigma regulatory factor